MVAGIENIRDVACFPRTPGNAEFWLNWSSNVFMYQNLYKKSTFKILIS